MTASTREPVRQQCIQEINSFMSRAGGRENPSRHDLVQQLQAIPQRDEYRLEFRPFQANRDVLAAYNRVAEVFNNRFSDTQRVQLYSVPALVGSSITLEDLKQRNLQRHQVAAQPQPLEQPPQPQAAPAENPGMWGFVGGWVETVRDTASHVSEGVTNGATTVYSYMPSLPWSASAAPQDGQSNNNS